MPNKLRHHANEVPSLSPQIVRGVTYYTRRSKMTDTRPEAKYAVRIKPTEDKIAEYRLARKESAKFSYEQLCTIIDELSTKELYNAHLLYSWCLDEARKESNTTDEQLYLDLVSYIFALTLHRDIVKDLS